MSYFGPCSSVSWCSSPGPASFPGLLFLLALLDILRGKLHTSFLCYKFSPSSHLFISFCQHTPLLLRAPFLKARGPLWLSPTFNTLVEMLCFSLMCPWVSKELCSGCLLCMLHFCLPSSAITCFSFLFQIISKLLFTTAVTFSLRLKSFLQIQ